MSLNLSRKPRPVIDPDLSLGKQYGYRDPFRHAQVRVWHGPAPARKRRVVQGEGRWLYLTHLHPERRVPP